MLRPITLGLRVLQILMALVVLALAASMISNQVLGSSPVTIRYSTFSGGFGMIVGAIGVAALYLTFIPSLVPLALDALAGLFFLGGLIAWAVGLRGVDNCTNGDAMLTNSLLNQGSIDVDDGTAYGVWGDDDSPEDVFNKLRGNCQRGQADQILQSLSFGVALSLVIMAYMQIRRGGMSRGSSGAYVA